jgi:peptidoglycan-associated lipoprotein
MTDIHFSPRPLKSGRAASIATALLSLSFLAACDAASGGEEKVPVTNTAAVDQTGGALMGTPTEGSLGGALLTVGDRVHFELDRYDLTPEAEQILQAQAKLMERYQQSVITIEGHADERGTREYNLALGERRADTVRNYLIALGVNPDRVQVVSYGKERPECVDADENCWALNRRGVTVASQ